MSLVPCELTSLSSRMMIVTRSCFLIVFGCGSGTAKKLDVAMQLPPGSDRRRHPRLRRSSEPPLRPWRHRAAGASRSSVGRIIAALQPPGSRDGSDRRPCPRPGRRGRGCCGGCVALAKRRDRAHRSQHGHDKRKTEHVEVQARMELLDTTHNVRRSPASSAGRLLRLARKSACEIAESSLSAHIQLRHVRPFGAVDASRAGPAGP